VFVVTFLLMGLNLWAAVIILLVVCMIIVHMLGCMAVAGINGNAVSLVNLVMVSQARVTALDTMLPFTNHFW